LANEGNQAHGLAVREITKSFGAVHALRGVSLEFRPGEVHGIVGENGAGKSTLMKILAGVQPPDSGEILKNGRSVTFASVRAALESGVALIHQELNLVNDLNVAENVFLGREPQRGLLIDRRRQREETNALLRQVNSQASADDRVGDLPLAQQQLVEIAKAVSYQSEIIIMDEPTAVLGRQEAEALFTVIEQLRGQGKTIIYISHLLPEVIRICDRISVLRDGEYVTTIDASAATPTLLANTMVGRELGDFYPAKSAVPDSDTALLEVSDLVATGATAISFRLRRGEILGIAGLVGAGRTELCEAIAGFRPRTGNVAVDGRPVPGGSPTAAVDRGIAYVSEDRKGKGLILEMPIRENVTLAHLRAFGRVFLDKKKEAETAARWREQLSIKAIDLALPVSSLSGGNQQKVSIAKWLETQPAVLLLDEPTRGVDIGAKREIYDLIVDLAKAGLGCVVVSSEMPELLGICHRVLVMKDHRLAGELPASEMNEQRIMALAAGVA
jgi:ribose transport system ATP-binding protein